MKCIIVFAMFATVYAVSGVTLSEVSVTEVSNLLKSYYKEEFNAGQWNDEYSKLLPFRFRLENGSFRYVISLPEYHYSDGMSWDGYAVTNNTLRQIGLESGTMSFWPYQLFVIERKEGTREIVYCNYGKQVVVDDTEFERKYAAGLKWHVLAEGASGELEPKVLDKSIGEILVEEDVINIVRVTPYLFKGKNAEILMNAEKEVTNLVQMPPCKKRVEECAALSAVEKFAVAKMYVENLKRRLSNVLCDSVLMVVGDMNGDGACDVYVSSDAEKSPDGGYLWRLYSGQTKQFAEVGEEVNVQSFEKAIIPSRVKASKDKFYRVVRRTGERYVIVLTCHEGRHIPVGYLDPTNIVRASRKKYGHKVVDFYTCLPSVDGRGIGNLEDLFTDPQAPLESMQRLKVEKIGL